MKNKKLIAIILTLSLALATAVVMLSTRMIFSGKSVELYNSKNLYRNAEYVTSEMTNSDGKCLKLSPEQEFGPTWEYSMKQVNLNNYKKIKFEFSLFHPNPTDEILFIISIFDSSIDNNNSLKYLSLSSKNLDFIVKKRDSSNIWAAYEYNIDLDTKFPNATITSFYFWNNTKKTFFIDNFKCTLE